VLEALQVVLRELTILDGRADRDLLVEGRAPEVEMGMSRAAMALLSRR